MLCAATVEERVPGFLKGKGQGWVTAEYAMLPRSTTERVSREAHRGGRTHEIQRLIGRSLRAVTDLHAFGERTITLDCDVLEADGGTRTAAINGAFVALHDALFSIANRNGLTAPPLRDHGDGGQRRHGGGRGAARPVLRRGLDRRGGHERGHDRRRATSSRCRAPRSRGRSIAPS